MYGHSLQAQEFSTFGAAALAAGDSGNDGELRLAGLGHRFAGHRKDDLDVHARAAAAFELAERLAHAAHDAGDHAGFGTEHEAEMGRCSTGSGGVDLLANEAQDVRGRANHSSVTSLGFERHAEHLTGYLEVRRDEGISVLGAHALGDGGAEHVVHDAAALLEVVKARQQRRDARAVVFRVKRADLVVAELAQ